jgi:hypothetical protein
MPNVIVVADTADGDATVFLAERLTTAHLDDAHFAAQLVERLKWAGQDAEQAERDATTGASGVGRYTGYGKLYTAVGPA